MPRCAQHRASPLLTEATPAAHTLPIEQSAVWAYSSEDIFTGLQLGGLHTAVSVITAVNTILNKHSWNRETRRRQAEKWEGPLFQTAFTLCDSQNT